MDRNNLIQQLQNYKTAYSREKEFIPAFLQLLNNYNNCYDRSLEHGHITGSSWIIDQSKKYVLLTHHQKLDKWLQLGGHADGDENVQNVAFREAEEESGLKKIRLLKSGIFDIDIHTIPARKGEQEHLHYDIRYLFEADRSEPLSINHESKALEWVALDEISDKVNRNDSIIRMVEKSARIN